MITLYKRWRVPPPLHNRLRDGCGFRVPRIFERQDQRKPITFHIDRLRIVKLGCDPLALLKKYQLRLTSIVSGATDATQVGVGHAPIDGCGQWLQQ